MENGKLQPRRERIDATQGDEDEDGDEEVNMETFFDLVRNFKEMRDRRRKELSNDEIEASERKKKMKMTQQNRSTWIPTFEREDFNEDFQVRRPPLVLPRPCNLIREEATTTTTSTKQQQQQLENEVDCLDLKLTL